MSTTAEDLENVSDTAAAASPFHAGDPAILGIPAFIAGSIVLGLNLIGYMPVASAGAPLPIILTMSALGLMVAAIWALALGQTVVAGIFGVFSLFWLSYGVLVLSLTHNWFGVASADVARTQASFLIAWLVVIGTMTLGSLRLPLAFSAVLVAVDLALAAVLAGVLTGTLVWFTLAGAFAFVFAALGVWIFLGATRTSTGGSALPLGRPIISS